MTRALFAPLLASVFALLGACVTINVYFPAAAAEKAADRVIDEVWGGQIPAAPAAAPVTPTSLLRSPTRTLALTLLDWVIPAAHADEPNLDISSPEIKRLTDSMEARFADLAPYFQSGAVGIGADGFIAARDPNLVPLPDRNKVRTLIANDNADRSALYREMALANKQPQWETQIRGVFAQRWAARAKSGWWVQNGAGEWSQKP
ncbi:MAG: YdbL family protein [Panacagrimonas sp.]